MLSCATGPARAPEQAPSASHPEDAGSALEAQERLTLLTEDPFGPTFGSDGGTWDGCRASGAKEVCGGLVTPGYFQEHPGCAQSTACRGVYFTCSRDCPPPASSQRPRPPPSIPREEREAGFRAFEEVRAALKGLSVREADARLKKMVRENPVFEAGGVDADGAIWVRFRDGRIVSGSTLQHLSNPELK